MAAPVVVHIVGAPIACAEGVKDTWREVAAWAADQLGGRFGARVAVEYHDLFELSGPLADRIAARGVSLPAVLVGDELLTSGSKISIPAIRRKLEALGIAPDGH